jgi:hypothetical protein
MIIVRNTFSIQPTRMKEAVALAKAGRSVVARIGFPVPRVSVDVAAELYTMVFETEFPSMADFEERLPKNFSNPDWQAWYGQFTELVLGGRREIFRVVE